MGTYPILSHSNDGTSYDTLRSYENGRLNTALHLWLWCLSPTNGRYFTELFFTFVLNY